MSNGRKCVGGKRKALLHQVAVPRGLCSMCGARFLCRLLYFNSGCKIRLKASAQCVFFIYIFFFLHARLPAQHIFTLSVLSYSGKVNSLKAHKYSHLRSESADSEHTLALAHKGAACSLSYQHLDPSRATDLGEKSLVWLTVSHSACWFNRRAVSRCSRLRVRSSSAPNYHLI